MLWAALASASPGTQAQGDAVPPMIQDSRDSLGYQGDGTLSTGEEHSLSDALKDLELRMHILKCSTIGAGEPGQGQSAR